MVNIFNIGKQAADGNRGRERYVAHRSRNAGCEPTLGGARWDYNAWLGRWNRCP